MSTGNSSNKLWRRRDVIKLLGATAITGPVIFRGTTANAATSKVIKIGYVTSQTGVLAPVSEADPFILDQIRTALAEGITNGGVSYKVQIINKDSQSKTNRASAVAAGQEPGRTGFDSGGDRGNRLPFGCRADQVVRETGQKCQQNSSGCRPMAKERHGI